MLRLIGAIVVVLLLIGPLMAQIGLLDNAGFLRNFVDLETQGFAELVAFLRRLVNRGG